MIQNLPSNRDDATFDSVQSAIESLPLNYRVLAELSVDRAEPEEDRADFLVSLADTGLPAAKFILLQEAKGTGPAALSAQRVLGRFRDEPEVSPPASSLDELFGSLLGGGTR